MHGNAPLEGGVSVDGAAGILQLGRLIGAAAVLAGVAVLIGRAAHRAGPADETVGQEALVGGAIHLLDTALLDGAVGLERLEDAHRVALVLRRMRRVVEVVFDLECLVVLDVLAVDGLDPFLRTHAGLGRADLDGRAVRVVGGDEERLAAERVHGPHEDVGLHRLDQMSEVDPAVGVSQGVRDDHPRGHGPASVARARPLARSCRATHHMRCMRARAGR